MKNTTKYLRMFTAGIATIITASTLVACSAQVEDSAGEQESHVTNCGIEETYPRPSAPVGYDVSAIEKMFSLGLADEMRGIVMPKTITSVIDNSPYREDYAKVETLSNDVLGQEALVNAQADWVFAGWQAGFSQERGVTPDSLAKLGINSYMQEETCYNFDKATDTGANNDPLELMYRDLTNLGDIFGVSQRSEELVSDLRAREENLKKRTDDERHRPKVFVYDSGTDEPYTAGNRASLNSMIYLAGGENITGDVQGRFTTVGWESVVAAEPETIVIIDYNKQPVQEKIDYLRTQSPLKDSPAVKEDRIHVIDYGEAMSSPRNIDGAEKLADAFENLRH